MGGRVGTIDLVTTDRVTAPASASRRRVRRLSWLWVLFGGAALYLLVLWTLVSTDNLNLFPSLLLLGSVVVPASVLVFAASGSRAVHVSSGLIAFVAVMGGVIGAVAAGAVEYDALHQTGSPTHDHGRAH